MKMETSSSLFQVNRTTILRDAKIILDNGTSHWIHKPSLACQSNFLEALFTHAKKKEYYLKGIPEKSFLQIQSWVFTQKMVFCSLWDAFDTLVIANYLSCLEIVQVLTAAITNKIKVKEVLPFWLNSTFYNLEELSDFCTRCIKRHFPHLLDSDDFVHLNLESLMSFLKHDDLNVNEEDAWKAVRIWIRFDADQRCQWLHPLLQCLRNTKIPNFREKIVTFLTSDIPEKKLAVELFSQTLQIQPVQSARRWPHTLLFGHVESGPLNGQPHFMAFEKYESVWKDVPVSAESSPLCFKMVTVNATIYLFGAKAETWAIRGAVYKFDVQQKKLIEVVGMTDYRTDFSLSVVGDKVYVIGGKRNERDLNDMEVFDAKTNSIRQCEALPFAVSDCTSASIGNVLFVAGGFNQNTTLLMFNTMHGMWAEGLRLPVRRNKGQLAATSDRLFMLGGQSGFRPLNMCHELVNGAWVARAPMRTARKDFAVAVVDESKIVVAGGKCHEITLRSVEVYNLIHDTWTTITPLPSPRSNFSMCYLWEECVLWSHLGEPKRFQNKIANENVRIKID